MLSHEDRVPATSRNPRYGNRSFYETGEPTLTLSPRLLPVNRGGNGLCRRSGEDHDHPVAFDFDRVCLRLELLDLDRVALDASAVGVEHRAPRRQIELPTVIVRANEILRLRAQNDTLR